jgi:aryl-phospho-beta-D-glucosidase BglC (GH1 family)
MSWCLKSFLGKSVLAAGLLLAGAGQSFGQSLPTAKTVASKMGLGWNLGNTMEATGGPTAWGNPMPTQALIKAVKAAGFGTIRIPCAWNAYTDGNGNIRAGWIDSVKQIVDWSVAEGLYVVLNIHWDGGWLEDSVAVSYSDNGTTKWKSVTDAEKAKVKAKQTNYWTQIANAFKSYNEHVIFAGANEPGNGVWDDNYFKRKDGTATDSGTAFMAVLLEYHQAFVDAVRATGGNNASRTLIFQGPKTNIEITNLLMKTMPTDNTAGTGYLMAEVHLYPYQFSLMEDDADWGGPFWFFGSDYSGSVRNYENGKADIDKWFGMLKTQFVDKGYPVVIGEFGAIMRMSLTADNLAKHLQSRKNFYEYIAKSAKAIQSDVGDAMIPILWDPGHQDNNTMSVFNRKTAGYYDLGAINALRTGWGLQPNKLAGDTTYPIGQNAMRVLYTNNDSLFGLVNLGVAKKNISAYDSVVIKLQAKGEMDYDSLGVRKYGFLNMNLVAMSGGYKWRDAPLKNLTINNGWQTFSIPLMTDSATAAAAGGLAPKDPTAIEFMGLQAYTKTFRGAVYVDYIAFVDKKNDGSIVRDTLYAFDMYVPHTFEGRVLSISKIALANIDADTEWKTLTTAYDPVGTIAVPFAQGNSVLYRDGSFLRAHGSITLYDITGKLVGSASEAMALGGLNPGLYLARSGSLVLKVNVQ